MNTMPEWRLAGDWFDICSCNIPCPCEFAQAPTNNACLGMLVWHIREGNFGDIRLDGFNLLALAGFEGNLWAGAKARMGLFIDEKADERQRQALQAIFAGQAGGWPAGFAASIGEFRGVEYVPISFEIADDLAHWQAEIPGRVRGRAEALRVQPHRRANGFKPLTRRDQRSGPARLRPGAVPTMHTGRASGSSSPPKSGPANIFRLIGRGLVPRSAPRRVMAISALQSLRAYLRLRPPLSALPSSIFGTLIGVTIAAWAFTLYQAVSMNVPMGMAMRGGMAADGMAGMAMDGMSGADWSLEGLAVFVALWTVMMVAMMLPGATPMILIFASAQSRRERLVAIPTLDFHCRLFRHLGSGGDTGLSCCAGRDRACWSLCCDRPGCLVSACARSNAGRRRDISVYAT